MGHALAEPGCIWLAASPEAVVAAAPAAIAAFAAWLRSHGEPHAPALAADGVSDHAPCRVSDHSGRVSDNAPGRVSAEVAEEQQVPRFGHSGAAVGLFAPDHEPVDDALIATVIRRLGYARHDLLAAVAALPPAALDWQPPGGKRTVRQNLEHVRNCQGWYLTRVLGWERVGELLPEPWPEETFTSLSWAMDRAVAALLDLPPALRAGLYRAEQPAEDWTPRKMLRRFVEHEIEHLQVVRRTIAAWQATGAPP